jgi:hypothetical protein
MTRKIMAGVMVYLNSLGETGWVWVANTILETGVQKNRVRALKLKIERGFFP